MEESVLDLNFNDVYEPKVLSEGEEVKLRISDAEVTYSKAGNKVGHIVLEVPNDTEVEEIHLYMGIPTETTEPKKRNKMLLRWRDFYNCFGVAYEGGVDFERDLIGAEGDCLVGVDDDPEFGTKNRVTRFIVPR